MIAIKTTNSGNHPNGKAVYEITMTNELGTSVKLTNYGAIIMAMKLSKKDGTCNDIALGFDTPQEYWSEQYLNNYPYYGAIIGRYANRIQGNTIMIDENKCTLDSKAAEYQLHGGIEGFDKKVWDLIDTDGVVTMQYLSADGEEGFPGNLVTKIIFTLTEDNTFSYEIIATTDIPTAVNITHHTYFNLNNGKGDILQQSIKIDAGHYLEQDENYCTTGKIIPVEGTRNDFTQYQQTGNIAAPEKGIDISFVRNQEGIEHLAASAFCDEESVLLEIFTTEPVVHLYNASGAPAIKGKEGKQYGPFSGFCLETQIHPNAINIPHFPNTILHPGEEYRTKTIYKFSEK